MTDKALLRALGVFGALAASGVPALAAADIAPAQPASWFQTGIWIGAGIVFMIVLAFFLSRLLPKNPEDNSDNPL
jgi:hypothetical protein